MPRGHGGSGFPGGPAVRSLPAGAGAAAPSPAQEVQSSAEQPACVPRPRKPASPEPVRYSQRCRAAAMRTQHRNQRSPARHSARKLENRDKDPAQPEVNKQQDSREEKTAAWNQEAPALQERHNQDASAYVSGPSGKESACNVGDLGWIPGSGRSPGGEPGNPLRYSCLENPMDREAWCAAVHGVTKSQTCLNARVCTHTHTHVRTLGHLCGTRGVSSFSQKAQRKSTDVSNLKIKSKITTPVCQL